MITSIAEERDLVRRAVIVLRERAASVSDPAVVEAVATVASALEGAALADIDTAAGIARSVLADTCALPAPYSSIGSVCGYRAEHEGGCGAWVADMPGLPVRTPGASHDAT